MVKLLVIIFFVLLSAPSVLASCQDFSRVEPFTVVLQDDLGVASLQAAVAVSQRYFRALPGHKEFQGCGQHWSVAAYRQILQELAMHLQSKGKDGLADFLRGRFDFCQAQSMLVTGYYEPVVEARRQRLPPFIYPLYGLPPAGKRSYSRQQIDGQGMLVGHEIAWLADPVQRFFIHVQGSALLEFAGGHKRRLSYSANNGRPYTSIGKVLIRQGKLHRDEVSLQTIKAYLASHPEQRDELFFQNSRYIYFSLAEDVAPQQGPTGALGQPLVTGRSVALDPLCYGKGGLGLLQVDLPGNGQGQQVNRLVFGHDQGAAIQGSKRLDLFVGQGERAGQLAGEMKQPGHFIFLVPKQSL